MTPYEIINLVIFTACVFYAIGVAMEATNDNSLHAIVGLVFVISVLAGTVMITLRAVA